MPTVNVSNIAPPGRGTPITSAVFTNFNASTSSYIGHLFDPDIAWHHFVPRLVWTGQADPHNKFRALIADAKISQGIYVVGHIQSNPFGYPFPTMNVYTVERDGAGFVIMSGIRQQQTQAPARIHTWPPKPN